MIASFEQRDRLTQRLEGVCREMRSFGKPPWSLCAELLDRWLELFEERYRLREILDEVRIED